MIKFKPPEKDKGGRLKQFTPKQIEFIRKAFMIPGVQQKFNVWIDDNLIYCQDTHSFVHLCFDEFKHCKDYRDAQQAAWNILDFMRLEFLIGTYDKESLKKAVAKVNYISPIEEFKLKVALLNQNKKETKCR